MGPNAGHVSTDGSHNTAIGYNAYSGQVTEGIAHDVKTTGFNTHVGYNAGFNTNADFNQSLGSFAIYANETENKRSNHQSNSLNVNANNNVTIGVGAMRNHNDDLGHDNTAVGTQAMLNMKQERVIQQQLVVMLCLPQLQAIMLIILMDV